MSTIRVERVQLPQFKLSIGGQESLLSKQEAESLFRQLSRAFSVPMLIAAQCDDRFSHKAHVWTDSATGQSGNILNWCGGRATDVT